VPSSFTHQSWLCEWINFAAFSNFFPAPPAPVLVFTEKGLRPGLVSCGKIEHPNPFPKIPPPAQQVPQSNSHSPPHGPGSTAPPSPISPILQIHVLCPFPGPFRRDFAFFRFSSFRFSSGPPAPPSFFFSPALVFFSDSFGVFRLFFSPLVELCLFFLRSGRSRLACVIICDRYSCCPIV